MSIPKAVRGWVADAEALHGPEFDEWVPAEFDWRNLCEDAPAMTEALGESFPKATAAAARARLYELAQAAFRGAYTSTLALLAGYDRARDPHDALDRLVQPLEDDEAESFACAVDDDLSVLDRRIGGEDVPADGWPDVETKAAAGLLALVLRPVHDLVRDGLRTGAGAVVSLGGGGRPSSVVLAGIVKVATILACFRYLAAAEFDRAEGCAPLDLDVAAIASALGGA